MARSNFLFLLLPHTGDYIPPVSCDSWGVGRVPLFFALSILPREEAANSFALDLKAFNFSIAFGMTTKTFFEDDWSKSRPAETLNVP
jgi:hypothetical protein